MKKKFVKTYLILIAAVMLIGACGTDTAGTAAALTKDPEVVIVAEVDGVPIYLDLYQQKYNSYKQLYAQLYDIEPSHEDLKEMALGEIINDIIIEKKLEELGYMELTQERIAKAESSAQNLIDDYLKQYYLDKDFTQEDLETARECYQNEVLQTYLYNMTWDELVDSGVGLTAYEDLKAFYIGDVTFVPTDEQIKELYNEMVACSREMYDENPMLYISYVLDGYVQYYVPAGVRRVRRVMIQNDEEAKGVLARLQSGEMTFEEAIAEYPDESMPKGGYPVARGDDHYPAEFTSAALGLENIGGITSLIKADEGYYILQYYTDETEGPAKYEDVYEDMHAEVASRLEQESWNAVLDEWKKEMGVIIFEDNLS